jgi:hypothetical protein
VLCAVWQQVAQLVKNADVSCLLCYFLEYNSFFQAFSLIYFLMQQMQPLLSHTHEFGLKICTGRKAVLRLQVFEIILFACTLVLLGIHVVCGDPSVFLFENSYTICSIAQHEHHI